MLKQDWPNAEWTARFMADPGGRQRQILPILLHKRDPTTSEPIEIPLLLRPIRRYDFSQPSSYEPEFAELLRKLRGERPRRGGWRSDGGGAANVDVGPEAPDEVREALVSNLLPVVRLPEHIWSSTSHARKPGDVWASAKGGRVPPFWLGDGRLYSFVPPDATPNPFRRLVGGPSRSEVVATWLKDPDRSRIILRLLNDALRTHALDLRIHSLRDNRRQFFCPLLDKYPRQFRWGGGGRVRTLSKLGVRPDGSTIGIHSSAKMRFLILGVDVFLLIEPGWMFTSDGLIPLEGKQVTILSTKFGGRERNAAVLRNVLMWSILLADGKENIRIAVGPTDVVVDAVPATADSPVGIDDDSIRLDRILAGTLGGEVLTVDPGDKELDEALAVAVSGDIDEEDDDPQLEAFD